MRCAILETFPEPNRRLLQRSSLSLSLPSASSPLEDIKLYSFLYLYDAIIVFEFAGE